MKTDVLLSLQLKGMQKPERMERKTGSLISLGSRAMVCAALHCTALHCALSRSLVAVINAAATMCFAALNRCSSVCIALHCTAYTRRHIH